MYLPTTPKEWDKRLRKTDSGKLPAFFEYAKGKSPEQITKRGGGVVDRIHYSICDYKFKFDKSIVGKLDPTLLMYEPLKEYGKKEEEIVDYFRRRSKTIFGYGGNSAYDEDDKYFFYIKQLKKDMQRFGSVQRVTDVLVHGLFIKHSVRRKSAFWDCFGDVVEMNLLNNLRENRGRCLQCGKRFRVPFGELDTLCPSCRPEGVTPVREADCAICGATFKTRAFLPIAICPACHMAKNDKNKCADCGAPIFNSGGKGRPSCRCRECQATRNRTKSREWKIKYRKR